MSSLITAVLAVALLTLAIPVLVLFVEILYARPASRREAPNAGERPSVAVLIPAHNEAGGIAATLDSLRAQLTSLDRLLVVADNCTDDTAQAAMRGGAEVVIRNDPCRRGKGYALEFGVRQLAAAPPEVLVIVDADCKVQPGGIDRLARIGARAQRPVQAAYVLRAPDRGASLREFACIVKNVARPLGLQRLGYPCQLTGSGMAIPWNVLRNVQLATSHIVEDMKLGLDFARAGMPPIFCGSTLVESTFPSSVEGTETQRTRWEHGHLSLLLSYGPSLLMHAVRRRALPLFVLTLDLCVPPVSLLCLLLVAAVSLSAIHAILTSSLLILGPASILFLMFGVTVILAWLRFGREVVTLKQLAASGWYALRKLPTYATFIVRRQVEWVRSKRDDG